MNEDFKHTCILAVLDMLGMTLDQAPKSLLEHIEQEVQVKSCDLVAERIQRELGKVVKLRKEKSK